jgi:hypothetical protein
MGLPDFDSRSAVGATSKQRGPNYKFGENTGCFLYDASPSAGTSKASQACAARYLIVTE